jgi:predicted RNase H-like nuclease
MRVLGVDGCTGGWVAVALDDGVVADVRIVASFEQLVDDPATIVGVDIPMGDIDGGRRRADQAARALLPRNLKSSIFNSPPLRATAATSYDDACHIALELTGKKLSKQSYALRHKILDVQAHWLAQPDRLYEVHPELAFQAMAGAPLTSSKKTWDGHRARSALLANAGIVLPDSLGGALGRAAAPDDVLDAAAVAWSAQRIAAGTATCTPDPPERDADGRAVAIWF